jgi:uncharacterized repeat protein (TIGR02543 family)
MEAGMRKKVLAAALAVLGLFVLAGCPVDSDDDIGSDGGQIITVSFDLGYVGAVGTPPDVTVEKDTPLGVNFPPYPTREGGYEFGGWYDGTDFSTATKYERASPPVTGNLTLTARWLAPCTVIFDVNGGAETIESIIVIETRTAGELFPANPTRTGHIFRGWFTGETEYTADTPITAPITIIARWEEGFVVTISKGYGADAPLYLEISMGQTISSFPEPGTREKFTFDGWFDVGNTEYTTATVITGNVEITAKWSKAVDVQKITAKNNAMPVYKFVVPSNDRFGDYTKITFRVQIVDQENFSKQARVRAYGDLSGLVGNNDFTVQENGYYFCNLNSLANPDGTSSGGGPYIVNNTGDGSFTRFAGAVAGQWFTIDLPLLTNRHSSYNAAAYYPADDATGDFYFALGTPLNGSSGDLTYYVTDIALSNDEGTNKILSSENGFNAPAFIGWTNTGEFTLE